MAMGNLHRKLCEKSRGKRSLVHCLRPPETFKNNLFVDQSDKEWHNDKVKFLVS